MQEMEFTTDQIKPIECVKEAWQLIKDDYWMLFAISIVGGMIAGATFYILLGPMICGIFYTYLKKVDGERISIDDLWVGFKYFQPSLIVALLIVVPLVGWMVFMFATLYLPLVMAAVGGSRVSGEELMAVLATALTIDLVIAIVMTCVHSLLIFSFQLIVDRGLSGWESVKLSARAVMKNLGGIGGLIALNMLMTIGGMLVFCIGMYLVIPLITATSIVAYRKVFPRNRAQYQY